MNLRSKLTGKTSTGTVTDEAVEKAARAIYAFPPGRRLEPWSAVTGTLRSEYLRAARAALEAAR